MAKCNKKYLLIIVIVIILFLTIYKGYDYVGKIIKKSDDKNKSLQIEIDELKKIGNIKNVQLESLFLDNEKLIEEVLEWKTKPAEVKIKKVIVYKKYDNELYVDKNTFVIERQARIECENIKREIFSKIEFLQTNNEKIMDEYKELKVNYSEIEKKMKLQILNFQTARNDLAKKIKKNWMIFFGVGIGVCTTPEFRTQFNIFQIGIGKKIISLPF